LLIGASFAIGMAHAPTAGMNQKAEELKARTAAFAKLVIELCKKASDTQAARTMTRQRIDAATSVASNYRSTCRARSKSEFVAKIGVVVEEADECYGWLKLLVETKALQAQDAEAGIKEADELTAIFVASQSTAKRHLAAAAVRQSKISE